MTHDRFLNLLAVVQDEQGWNDESLCNLLAAFFEKREQLSKDVIKFLYRRANHEREQTGEALLQVPEME